MTKGAQGPPHEDHHEVLMVGLRVGDQFVFDDTIVTVVEPPEDTWGIVEVRVTELDFPLAGSSTASTVWRQAPSLA